jgi:hypothetical protein
MIHSGAAHVFGNRLFPAPSPGIPGEGWGEGSLTLTLTLSHAYVGEGTGSGIAKNERYTRSIPFDSPTNGSRRQ